VAAEVTMEAAEQLVMAVMVMELVLLVEEESPEEVVLARVTEVMLELAVMVPEEVLVWEVLPV